MSRILVVDDEPLLLRAVSMNLTSRHYDVVTAATAGAAFAAVVADNPDLVILDLGLPDMDGMAVVRELRVMRPALPIVVLSARTGSHDKVEALDLGAVDYVTKPFEINELLARVRAALRRPVGQDDHTTLAVGPNTVDLRNHTVTGPDGEPIHLTPTEWRILRALVSSPGRLVSSRELLTAVRGDPDHTESSYLRIYLSQLRRKLEPEPGRPRHLLTEPGMGYRFQP